MSQELIYTSAPRGLKPGSRGFCTVVSTFGMAANMAQRLESLSGYRHVYGPQDPNARLNPPVFSHLRLTVGGRMYHVLSRIADAGLDYTQRTNKLAHHVVLDVAERVPGGPAWLMRQPGFLATAFDSEPHVLPAGRKFPTGDEAPGICHHWARLTGDAGWGGALAEAAALGRKAFLVFRPGMELLPLLAESLALLSPERRWNVTFSTYFTGLPPGLDCQITCVLDGSPEQARMRRTRDALAIDLFRPAGSSPAGPYAEAARSGNVSVLASVSSPPVGDPASSQPSGTPGGLEEALQELAAESGSPGDTTAGPPPRGGPTGSPPPLGPSASSALVKSQAGIALRRFRRKEPAKWPYALLVSVVVLILVVSGAAVWWAGWRGREAADAKPTQNLFDDAEEGTNAPAEEVGNRPPAAGPEALPSQQPGSTEDSGLASSDTDANGPEESEALDRPDPKAEPAASPQPDGAQESASRKERETGESADTQPRKPAEAKEMDWPDHVELVGEKHDDDWYTILDPGSLHNDDTLELAGLTTLFSSTEFREQKASDEREWRVEGKVPFATFVAPGDGSLRFRWETTQPRARVIRNCRLVVHRNGTEVASIALRGPQLADKVPSGRFLDTKIIDLPNIDDLPDIDYLKWEFTSEPLLAPGLPTIAFSSEEATSRWNIDMRQGNESIDGVIRIEFINAGRQIVARDPRLTITLSLTDPGRISPVQETFQESGPASRERMSALQEHVRVAIDDHKEQLTQLAARRGNAPKKQHAGLDEQKREHDSKIEELRQPARLVKMLDALDHIYVAYRIHVTLGEDRTCLLVEGSRTPPKAPGDIPPPEPGGDGLLNETR